MISHIKKNNDSSEGEQGSVVMKFTQNDIFHRTEKTCKNVPIKTSISIVLSGIFQRPTPRVSAPTRLVVNPMKQLWEYHQSNVEMIIGY
jgi:hypothetical protein